MKRNVALIPAAGVGARFGANKPKQYVEINGKSVLQHTVDIFEQHDEIDFIVVIVSPFDDVFQTASSKVGVFRVGGETRAETVRNGVQVLLEQEVLQPTDNILVHDAARCCLPKDALTRLLHEAGEAYQGGILAIPVADTLKKMDGMNAVIDATISREGVWQAQTPQLFQAGLLQQALSAIDLSKVTDEASAIEQLGIKPLLVLGDTRNLKMTLPQDEIMVRLLLSNQA